MSTLTLPERERVQTLSRSDATAVQRMLDKPLKPNKALAKAQQGYQTQLGHGYLHTNATYETCQP
jgi:uncharacterized protein (DUF1778 family)